MEVSLSGVGIRGMKSGIGIEGILPGICQT